MIIFLPLDKLTEPRCVAGRWLLCCCSDTRFLVRALRLRGIINNPVICCERTVLCECPITEHTVIICTVVACAYH